MTINYLDSKRLQGLSTDIVETLTFEDDFSSYADQASADAVWARSSINNIVNVSTDKIDFNFKRGTNARISKDLGAGNVSDTAWVLRFKIRFSALTENNKALYVVFSTSDYSASTAVSQDSLGVGFGSGLSINALENVSSNNAIVGDYNSANYTWVTGTDYYIEIKRLSATTTSSQAFSDSGYSTSLVTTSSQTIPSGASVVGLRYLKIFDDASFSITSDTGLGTIDDIKFYNGVTTISNYWTEEA